MPQVSIVVSLVLRCSEGAARRHQSACHQPQTGVVPQVPVISAGLAGARGVGGGRGAGTSVHNYFSVRGLCGYAVGRISRNLLTTSTFDIITHRTHNYQQ